MDFSAQAISYSQTGYFTRIIADYLGEEPFLKDYYGHPGTMAGIGAAIRDREQFPTDRPLLTESLKDQYRVLPEKRKVNDNIEKLLLPQTFTVTTAHQPAIFTGNLYFVYKILHTIKLAQSLQAHFPDRHFVPVYYMGSEDADLDELGHVYLDREKLVWETKQSGAVGRMSTDGLDRIMDRIEGEFSGEPFGPSLVELLRNCYLQSSNIQEATFKLLHHLFGDYGLITFIPDEHRLKSVMRGIFRDDLTAHIPYRTVDPHIRALSERYPLQANPREINLFYLHEDIRERIEFREDHFHVVNTGIRFTPEAMEKELANHPERFSPNVILRGLYQETLLPNIAFVGGGGELAYWLELKSLFSHYRVPYPVLVMRNSFLLIRRNWKNKMDKAGLTSAEVFKPEEQLMEDFVRKNSNRQLTLDRQKEELQKFYQSLKAISASVDKTLEQHVSSLEAQALQKLDELEKKIVRAEKKNHEEARRKIHEIREALFPLGNLQERIENFIPWYAEYGNRFFELILQHSGSLEQEFVVLEEVG